jgi:hypothetical protein
VGCKCAAGVYLVGLDDDYCSWDLKQPGETPQCATIDIMEANNVGFNTASLPCEFGVCEEESHCKRRIVDQPDAYGPGSQYKIDTTQSYNVKTKFYTRTGADGEYTDLRLIKTILTQNGVSVELEQDCDGYLDPFTNKLQYGMAMGISTWSLDTAQDISDGTCSETCNSATTVIKNVKWTENDSTAVREWGGPAESLTSGNCGEDCTECRESWMSDDVSNVEAQCYDYTVYKYTNECKSEQNNTKCMTGTGSHCFMSYPHEDPDRQYSEDAACRTVPTSYIEGEWHYSKRMCHPSAGLCIDGCGTQDCRRSWPSNDEEMYYSAKNMCRCGNQFTPMLHGLFNRH